MISRPSNLPSRGSRIGVPTVIARRSVTSRQRNPGFWRVGRSEKRYPQAPKTLDGAIVAVRVSSATAHRQSHSNSRWRAPYAGRLITFGVAVAIIHLAILRWIFLPIGG